ncbi:hypothetical protein MHF_0366 [Mycoplasma haemofelis Ohio2]|uniref:Uncharacterized protein n=1 Tax=Mycoplasma haemofelis (strain Ohio2) TaxID=859194 RepID=F6FH38_MYCHI|nr:hypothetical protein MHF_0366 [Mycoplasma haemofelis Ohio2]
MSKFTPIAVLIGGTGGALGSYHSSSIKPKHKTFNPKLNVRFKDKYKNPLLDLDGDKDIWDAKWNSLKTGKPIHPKLQKAIETKERAEDSKKLHREGCQDIYNSATMATPYFLDFKYYCSKTNKDVIKGNWISANIKDNKKANSKSEWDEPLKDLEKADKKSLGRELLELLRKIDPKTPQKFDDSHREKLKEWCDFISEEFYLGDSSRGVDNAKRFCLKKEAQQPAKKRK